MRRRLLLTGGGTAGHVLPHLALLPDLRAAGWELHYAGRPGSIEARLLAGEGDVRFHRVPAGKLRRYWSWRHLTDAVLLAVGLLVALVLMLRLRPALVFSKGGFVGVPVVMAAWVCRVPVLLHESDQSPGLANRLAARFARKIAVTAPATRRFLPAGKTVVTGMPLRASLFTGDRAQGLRLTSLSGRKPVVLFMGGSLGSRVLNEAVRTARQDLLARYEIIHLTGENDAPDSASVIPGYVAWAYAGDELPHLLALADLVVARAGASTVVELRALAKPAIFVPLSRQASRGDQLENADAAAAEGWARVLPEEALSAPRLVSELEAFAAAAEAHRMAARAAGVPADGRERVLALLHDLAPPPVATA